MNILGRLLSDNLGATAAEYALVLAVIGAAVAVAAFSLGGSIGAALRDAGTCISTAGTAGC